MAKRPKPAPPLCELPAVFRLVNLFTVLLDHCGKRRPGFMMNADGTGATFDAWAVEVLAGVGLKAEWVDGTRGRKKCRGLAVSCRSRASLRRLQANLKAEGDTR